METSPKLLKNGDRRRKCQFFVEKKQRSCRMWALRDENFCGEHTIHDTENSKNGVPEDRLRMKCPLDGTHTCFVKKLQKHLKVCNARVTVVPPYYVQDINSGDGAIPDNGMTIHQLSDQALLSLLDQISTLYGERVRQPAAADGATHPLLAESLSRPELGADTLKHLRQNAALLAVLRDAGLLHGPRTFVELGSGKAQLSFWLARAVDTQSQIVLVDRASHRHKAENKLKDLADMPDIQRLKIDICHLNLSGCDACIDRPVVAISKHLCGAATDLGIRAATAAPMPDTSQPPVSQVESAAASAVQSESTAASRVQPASTETPATQPESIEVPATQPESTEAPTSQSESTEAPATHPESTEAPATQPESTEAPATQPESTEAPATQPDCPGPASSSRAATPDVQGILIALCCHHRVEWASYVGKLFLQECGFSAEDFTALKGVAAWATCGTPSWDRPQRNGDQPRVQRETPASGHDRAPSDQATADQATADQATGDQTTADQATADQVTADTTPADQTSADQTTADQAATDLALPEQTQKRPGSAEEADAKRARLEAAGPGSRDASAGRYHRLGLTPEWRTAVGFMCKRLMDEGRVRYLTARGFSARLVRYVPAAVSPENVLLLATRGPGSAPAPAAAEPASTPELGR